MAAPEHTLEVPFDFKIVFTVTGRKAVRREDIREDFSVQILPHKYSTNFIVEVLLLGAEASALGVTGIYKNFDSIFAFEVRQVLLKVVLI